jgi:hypothetical protein
MAAFQCGLTSLEDAWRGGLLQVGEDGSLVLCGQVFKADWDQVKIRRKLEDIEPGWITVIALLMGVQNLILALWCYDHVRREERVIELYTEVRHG